MSILKEQTPIAKKEHVCNWCGGKIAKGEKYRRDTIIFDGSIYDWKSHLDCHELTGLLDMYDYDDGDGIDEVTFEGCVNEYICTHHYDKEVDNTVKNWIARDKDGMLYLYDSKPYLPFDNASYYDSANGYYYDLPIDWFPELTFENSPKQVELKLI